MKSLVQEAMESGAIGVSTALIYPPAVYATTDEIAALVEVAGQYGGRYYTHMRNEGDQLEQAIGTLGLVETQPRARDTLNIAYDLGVRPWGDKYGPPPADPVSGHLIEMSKLINEANATRSKDD